MHVDKRLAGYTVWPTLCPPHTFYVDNRVPAFKGKACPGCRKCETAERNQTNLRCVEIERDGPPGETHIATWHHSRDGYGIAVSKRFADHAGSILLNTFELRPIDMPSWWASAFYELCPKRVTPEVRWSRTTYHHVDCMLIPDRGPCPVCGLPELTFEWYKGKPDYIPVYAIEQDWPAGGSPLVAVGRPHAYTIAMHPAWWASVSQQLWYRGVDATSPLVLIPPGEVLPRTTS